MTFERLAPSFYELPTLELATALLGKILVKETVDGVTAGWIVETEAYIGPGDRAAHSFNNRRTNRTEVMFGPPGFAYVYQMHTHNLVNVVSGLVDHPEAVLIRAVQPYKGLELMYKRREKAKKESDLTSGPGKLTKAFGIDKTDNGRTLLEGPLYIAEGLVPESVSVGSRIGINNSGEAKDYPWRFWISGNKFVSK